MLGALPACGSDDEQTQDEGPSGTLEVFSWWVTGGEKAAFDALVGVYNEKYPNVEVVNASLDDAMNARMIFQDRMAAGDPPDTFQSTAAAGIFQWVGDGDAASSQLLNLDAMAASEGWNDAFSPEVRNLVTFNDSMWAVPVNVHRINSVMYSQPMLDAAGVTTDPKTMNMDELLAACELLDADGKACIGLGVNGGWTASLWIIDGVMPAVAGPEVSRSFLRGELAGDDAAIVDTLNAVAALLPYTNADRGELEWDAAAHLVTDGTAAFNPMGDWAYAELKSRGEPGTDFDVIGHPGAQATYVMNFDTFPVTAGAKNRKAAEAWLKVVGSEEGQVAFNSLKGSIPARTISNQELIDLNFDDYGHRAIADFAEPGAPLRAFSTIVPPDLEGEMNDMFKQFVLDGDVDTAVTWFVNNYSRFQP